MSKRQPLLAFGPVPSRRFGRSLGVNNIPYKMCTYSCVYCQLGPSKFTQSRRCAYYDPLDISSAVEKQVLEVEARGESVDFITFVPDGEPTLDRNIGEEIRRVKSLGHKIAVITNGSLLWKEAVRNDLELADWVSVKVDSVQQKTWRSLNRADSALSLKRIQDGMLEFSLTYHGNLSTETMLIDGLNDSPEELDSIAAFITKLSPYRSYLAIPTRPPAEKWVQPATAYKLAESHAIFQSHRINTEYIISYEGDEFSSTGNAAEDLLSITSVHPMRKGAVQNYLMKSHGHWSTVESLLAADKLSEITYSGNTYYIRNFF